MPLKVIGLLGLISLSAFAQLQTVAQSLPDSSELFRLASSSDLIAIGTITGHRPAGRRLRQGEKIDDLSKTLGGYLYSFRVERLICARTDFVPGVPRPRLTGKTLYIFKKREQFFYGEQYREKQRYLMMFAVHPEQNKLSTTYKLEENRTYYEAFEGEKGLIALSGRRLPLLGKLEQLCGALRHSKPEKKVRLLNRLTTSPDPELRHAALSALDHLRKNIGK